MRFLLFFVSFLFASDIYVASCANTSFVMPQIVKAFHKKYPLLNVHLIFSSSGKLTAQITHNANYDIFLSADMKYPMFLYQHGFALEKPKVYAYGKLILISQKKVDLNNLSNLSSIAVANPKLAPYGKAAIEVLKNLKIYNKVKQKLIYAPSVSGVVPYVLNGVEAGFVSSSFIPKLHMNVLQVPISLYTPIKQGVVLLKDKKEAREFYNFLFSKEAKEILKKYGYGV